MISQFDQVNLSRPSCGFAFVWHFHNCWNLRPNSQELNRKLYVINSFPNARIHNSWRLNTGKYQFQSNNLQLCLTDRLKNTNTHALVKPFKAVVINLHVGIIFCGRSGWMKIMTHSEFAQDFVLMINRYSCPSTSIKFILQLGSVFVTKNEERKCKIICITIIQTHY